MRDACAGIEVWPNSLLDADFLEGMCALAEATAAAGVSEAALAAAAADDDWAISAVARVVVAYRARSQNLPVEARRRAGRVAGASPLDLAEFGKALGVLGDGLAAALRVVEPVANGGVRGAAEAKQAPWTWPAHEPDRRLVAPAMTFSASRLNTFAKCPRRWYYEYLCEAVEDFRSVHATYGKVFHAALETLHRDVRMPSQLTQDEIFIRLRRALDTAFGAAHDEFASELEYQVCRRKARAVAEHYARWLHREATARPVDIRDVEVQQRWSGDGHLFVGYIDRIDRPLDGGPVTIYDYKTGRIDEDARAYLARMRSGEEGQLALYWAMRRALGENVGRLALVSIRDPRDAVWLLALDIVEPAKAETGSSSRDADGVVRATCTTGDLERAVAALLERCDLLAVRGLEHFGPGEDPPCSFCEYARACRERPAVKEQIFAR